MDRRYQLLLCWYPGWRGGDQVLGGGHLLGEAEVAGPGHHLGAGLHLEEGLEVVEEGLRLQGEGPLPEEEGHLHQEGEAGQGGGQEPRPEDPEDPQLGLHEAGLAVQQGAGDTHHPAVQTPPVRVAVTAESCTNQSSLFESDSDSYMCSVCVLPYFCVFLSTQSSFFCQPFFLEINYMC